MTPTPLPPIAWNPVPACENRPQSLAAWRQYVASRNSDPLAGRQLATYLRQVRPMSAALRDVGLEVLPSLLDAADTAPQTEVIRRELTVLWLNVMSGRLNQATEMSFPALPGVRTVGDLIAELEKALVEGRSPGTLMSTSKQLVAGQGVSRSVCARFVFQVGTTLRESTWTSSGMAERSISNSKVPSWVSSVSPNHSKIAIITSVYGDSGGGPVLIYDLQTEKLTNINENLGIPFYEPVGMSVAGWHPDNQHLLLFDGDNYNIYWVDLGKNTYQRIGLLQGGDSTISDVNLSPDGRKFVYIGNNFTDDVQQFNLYDLRSGQITTLFTLPFNQGGLYSLRFSPTGDMIAYVVQKSHPLASVTYAIQLFDLRARTNTTLVGDNLGWTMPVWSPNGQMIAFTKKEPGEPNLVVPGVVSQPEPGNIWVVSVPSGKLQQVTFIQGAARVPSWSADGRFIAFVTHDNQLGLTSPDQPGVIWRMGVAPEWPEFPSIFFMP